MVLPTFLLYIISQPSRGLIYSPLPPDISYAVQQVCLFNAFTPESRISHALNEDSNGYVLAPLSYGLQLIPLQNVIFMAYSMRIGGLSHNSSSILFVYCVFLETIFSPGHSKRQFTLSRSSAEAEYRGVANAVAETCWLRNLLRELHTPLATATLVYCDNVSAVYLSSNPVQHQRTKHIEIALHFVLGSLSTTVQNVFH
ncbi:ribonuclease H-like domain-containing protein [Tanacetum coccineum]